VTAKIADLPLLEPGSRAEWRAWLAENHAVSPGVWLAVGKKGHTATTLTYDEAVEEALCFGWIDSVVNRLDESRFKQLVTPRKRGSIWARSNKDRVERLVQQKLMTPAGQAVIDAAKADGSWSLLDDVESLIVPEDLQAALDGDPGVAQAYSAMSESTQKMVLYRIAQAKRPETRARRISEVVERLQEGRPPL